MCQRLHDFGRVGITHYFLLVQIWARNFCVQIWTRFISRATQPICYIAVIAGTMLGSKILCTNLDRIHFETDSLINRLHVSTLVHDIRRVGITHHFLLVQIWARKFSVCFWTRFILRQTHWSICYTADNTYTTLGEYLSRIISFLYKFGLKNSVYIFGQDSFRDRLIIQSVICVSVYTTLGE